jgi:undecaprenyl pyrophosphate phosphatase UppP
LPNGNDLTFFFISLPMSSGSGIYKLYHAIKRLSETSMAALFIGQISRTLNKSVKY